MNSFNSLTFLLTEYGYASGPLAANSIARSPSGGPKTCSVISVIGKVKPFSKAAGKGLAAYCFARPSGPVSVSTTPMPSLSLFAAFAVLPRIPGERSTAAAVTDREATEKKQRRLWMGDAEDAGDAGGTLFSGDDGTENGGNF